MIRFVQCVGLKKVPDLSHYLKSPPEYKILSSSTYDGYDKNIISFPNVICGSCKQNLYLLKSGHTSRGSWGLQVAKVFCILIAIKCILFQCYVKELNFFVWMHYMGLLFLIM